MMATAPPSIKVMFAIPSFVQEGFVFSLSLFFCFFIS